MLSNSQASPGETLGFHFFIQAAWGLTGGLRRRLRAKYSSTGHRTHLGRGQGGNAYVRAPM